MATFSPELPQHPHPLSLHEPQSITLDPVSPSALPDVFPLSFAVIEAAKSAIDGGFLDAHVDHVRLIRRSARELLLCTGGTASPLPSAATKHDPSYVKDDDLEVMVRASQEILCNLESMAATRRRRGSRQEKYLAVKLAEEGAHVRGQHHTGRSNFVQPDKKYRNTALVCHACAKVTTPQWRLGPDGPGTLCNVCGLIYARRCRGNGTGFRLQDIQARTQR
jgi:hypothetical protein